MFSGWQRTPGPLQWTEKVALGRFLGQLVHLRRVVVLQCRGVLFWDGGKPLRASGASWLQPWFWCWARLCWNPFTATSWCGGPGLHVRPLPAPQADFYLTPVPDVLGVSVFRNSSFICELACLVSGILLGCGQKSSGTL